jgi:hypothetical protein
MMSSNASKKEGFDSENEDSNSVPSKPEDDEQSRMRWSETSLSTTNEPSSASATVVIASVARHPTVQSTTLPTLALAAADATAVAAPAVCLREKKPRRAGFREQFLQKVKRTSKFDETYAKSQPISNNLCSSQQHPFRNNSSESCWTEKAKVIEPPFNGR